MPSHLTEMRAVRRMLEYGVRSEGLLESRSCHRNVLWIGKLVILLVFKQSFNLPSRISLAEAKLANL
jgi:hypothetical protein